MEEKLKNTVLAALGTVQDPDLKKDLVSLGMIQALQLMANEVQFDLVLTTPACPLREALKKACITAIQKAVGETIKVTITLKANVPAARTHSQDNLKLVKNVIAICAGKGGVGKSTLAANLAIGLAQQGAAVGLLDADIFGPSLPTLLGCAHQKPGFVEKDGKKQIVPLLAYGVKLVSMGSLVSADEAVIWRGPMASTALKQLLYDAAWEALDYLLVDLPPGTSDIHLTLVQNTALAGVVIVTTPQQVALLDVIKNIGFLKTAAPSVPLLGVIENMAYYRPEGLSEEVIYYPLGKGGGKALATRYQIPFLGEIPLLAAISEASDRGTPPALDACQALFASLASALAQQVTIFNLQKDLPDTL
jgi:ATP-binding protein involved in chromosome partitioning